jgi:hypothetical protein
MPESIATRMQASDEGIKQGISHGNVFMTFFISVFEPELLLL